jgi:hypothetical protein
MTSYILFEEGESPIGIGQNLAVLNPSSLQIQWRRNTGENEVLERQGRRHEKRLMTNNIDCSNGNE